MNESDPAADGLFSPFTLRGVSARNRIVVSPMCQYSSVDGGPTDWHLVQFGRFAMGGAGIVFTEETAVEARGRKTYQCAGLWQDDHVSQYRRITDFIRAQDAVPALQIGHSGRKASVHGARQDWAPLTDDDAFPSEPPWQGLAPSPIPSAPGHHTPREMDAADIGQALDTWAEAARRADDAGFDILEIHGAHGYLLHQFLSPVSNQRTDAYGGDLDGRMRFPLEVTETVRAAWPADKPLFFRVSAVDGKGGAWTLDDTVVLSRELRDRGVDLIDCSSGGITGDSDLPMIARTPGYHVPFAERIRAESGVPTIAVGLITEPEPADAIIRAGQADLCALARELLWNPNWPAHAAKQLGQPLPYDVMPEEIAFRLRRRDEVAEMDINQKDGPGDGQVGLVETT